MITFEVDKITKAWIRDAADERAASLGYRFDILKGAWTVWWIERYCKLYEGEGYAGKSLILRGCHQCAKDIEHLTALPEWDPKKVNLRARLYMECIKAGHRVDWQYEFAMRFFSWVKHSEKWNREVRRFTQGSIWVPKKSKKSPTLAAMGIYLMAGDGEPGQKVFLAAKDGTQAREIAGKHAHEMLLQSKELLSECTFNMNLHQITHNPSRSTFKPLSSNNSRTQESKQGLNGSLLVDETHVVDREFINQINRMGISRSEPVHLEFSTAGNDPDSYGKERSDYAKDVVSGKLKDNRLLGMIYEAPPDLTDVELDSNPVKYFEMANPALGHTIDIEEITHDYESSKVTIAKCAEFQMYRLNKWQRSTNQWLKEKDWASGNEVAKEAEYEEMLKGEPCYMALDMSQVSDLTAIALAFPKKNADEKDMVRLLVYTFCAQEMAEANSHTVDYLDWARDGYITICDGRTIRPSIIMKEIIRLDSIFKILEFNYDIRFAVDIADRVENELRIPCIKFPQNFNAFAGAIDKCEGLALEGNWKHSANPCMAWQMSNACVKSMPSGGKMIVKPEELSIKKVDGVVAGIMATSAALVAPVPSDYYANASIEDWMG